MKKGWQLYNFIPVDILLSFLWAILAFSLLMLARILKLRTINIENGMTPAIFDNEHWLVSECVSSRTCEKYPGPGLISYINFIESQQGRSDPITEYNNHKNYNLFIQPIILKVRFLSAFTTLWKIYTDFISFCFPKSK